ncbi:tetratricopeptide (TPR) repeat protein [Pedobacter sp. UYP30]|uniref:tetratricopeptide repeat protein n=1 Tax=Pedobacter sp. UYP30 TaxID=1756400 RepID=UPI003394C142
MRKTATIALSIFVFISVNTFAQKTQILIARNSVGKLQLSILNKEDNTKQLDPVKEGLKAIESAENDKKTKDWAETWAIKSYLNSYAAIIETDANASQSFYNTAVDAVKQARKLDRYDDNSGLIKASDHNLLIKKQDIGNQYFVDNDFKLAFTNLKEVSDNFPADTTLALNTAICAINLQMYTDAMTYFKRAVENGIRNPAVYQKMAQIYSAKFDDKTALATLEEGLALNPQNIVLTNDYINLLIDVANYPKALALINGQIKATQGDKLLYYLVGYLEQATGNKSNAILSYNQALEKDPNYFDAMYQLGLAFIEAGNNELKSSDPNKNEKYKSFINRAEIALEHANEIDPNSKNCVQLLIDIYTRKNELDKVQELESKLREF